MSKSSSGISDMSKGDHIAMPVVEVQTTFKGREELLLNDFEKKMLAVMKRKKDDWKKQVQQMRQEFLTLYPSDKTWGSEEMLTDPMVIKRKGSTDVLDTRKTAFLEYPDSTRRFRLHFSCVDFNPQNMRVTTNSDRILVQATKMEEDKNGETAKREYVRKIEKPKDVGINTVSSFITRDGILVVEASLPLESLLLGPTGSLVASSPVCCPYDDPCMPMFQKLGVPTYIDAENGMRRMSLLIDVKKIFSCQNIMMLVIKEDRIKIKAKKVERTSERLSIDKFSKEFQLPEKIGALTLRAGLSQNNMMVVGAVAKGHSKGMTAEHAAEWIKDELHIGSDTEFYPCRVLDLTSFPPADLW